MISLSAVVNKNKTDTMYEVRSWCKKIDYKQTSTSLFVCSRGVCACLFRRNLWNCILIVRFLIQDKGNKTGILKKILIVIYNFDIGVSPQESFFI